MTVYVHIPLHTARRPLKEKRQPSLETIRLHALALVALVYELDINGTHSPLPSDIAFKYLHKALFWHSIQGYCDPAKVGLTIGPDPLQVSRTGRAVS